MHAFATPLLTKADGTKYGKTEGGALWLDPEMLSPYAFFQFWLNVEDEKIGELLRVFTFLDRSEIEELEAAHAEKPFLRAGQKALAEHVTTPGARSGRDRAHPGGLRRALRRRRHARAEPRDPGRRAAPRPGVLRIETRRGRCRPWSTSSSETGLAKSKGDARRTVAEGGAYVNNVRVEDPEHVPGPRRPGRRHLAGAAQGQEELQGRRGRLTWATGGSWLCRARRRARPGR